MSEAGPPRPAPAAEQPARPTPPPHPHSGREPMGDAPEPGKLGRTQPAGHGDHAEHVHVVPLSTLAGVFALLMLLTWATVAVTQVDLGPTMNVWVALLIALVKAAAVCLWFMHLRYDSPLYSVVLVSSLLVVVLFIGAALSDSAEYEPNVLEPWEAGTGAVEFGANAPPPGPQAVVNVLDEAEAVPPGEDAGDAAPVEPGAEPGPDAASPGTGASTGESANPPAEAPTVQ